MMVYTPPAKAVLAATAWSIPYFGYPGGLNTIQTAYTSDLQFCKLYCQSFNEARAETCIGIQWKTDTKKCKTFEYATMGVLHCDPLYEMSWLETCLPGLHRSPGGVCTKAVNPTCGPVPSPQKKRGLTLDARIQGGETLCIEPGYYPCPIGAKGGFECVDTDSDLWSCGGCTYAGISGQDCTSIAGTNAVSCQQGKCIVDSCQSDYTLGSDKSFCSRNKNAPAIKRRNPNPHLRV